MRNGYVELTRYRHISWCITIQLLAKYHVCCTFKPRLLFFPSGNFLLSLFFQGIKSILLVERQAWSEVHVGWLDDLRPAIHLYELEHPTCGGA